jgi:NAD(P)-dependent dehydrogenase (short-subunit alcohol dehydrogenase family)
MTRESVSDSWKRRGRRAILLPGDISDDAHCADIVRATMGKLGRLDLLVTNAAYQGKSVERFDDIDADRVRKTLLTNIGSMFFVSRHAVAHLPSGGAIINTASITAYQPGASTLDYVLAARGIRVNAVAPGPVWTPLVVQSFKADHVTEFGKQNPFGRPAQPAELAPTYVFLACDESRFIPARSSASWAACCWDSLPRARPGHSSENLRGATGIPCAIARRIRSAVVLTSSFRFMLLRWLSTVLGLMQNRCAISLPDEPATT